MNTHLSKKFTVMPHQSAANMGSGLLDVLSTPSLIALMEHTAQELLLPIIPKGKSSVGTEINMKHLAATAIGKEITIEVTLTKHTEKLFNFEIIAFEQEKLIGKASHQRAIIDINRFLSKL